MRFILLTVLIDMVSIGLIIPVLPELVGHFTTDRSEQAFWYGAIMLTFGVANFFFAPILGGLSDQFGRRPVLLIGFCGFAFSFFATALATQLWMLIVIRVVSGALQANASVANAYVADITAPEDRAKRFGQLGAMFGLGFILGPVMGGLLGAIDIRLPFFVSGGLALLNLAYGYFVLPESLPLAQRRPMSWQSANPIRSLKQLTQLKGIGPLVLVIALGRPHRCRAAHHLGALHRFALWLGAARKRLVLVCRGRRVGAGARCLAQAGCWRVLAPSAWR